MPVIRRATTRTKEEIEQSLAEQQEEEVVSKKPEMSELDKITVAMPDNLVLMLGYGNSVDNVTKHPNDIPTEVLRRQLDICDENDEMERHYRKRIRSPLTAIRAFCVLCSVGPKAANKCSCVSCPLWVFRRGSNPFYGKRAEESDD